MIRGLAGRPGGFTMIELLLYMGIFSVLIAVISGIFVSIMELQLQTHSTSEVTQNANYISSRFQYDLYQAQNVSVPASAGQTASSLTISINAQNYTYSLSGPNLILTSPSGTYTLNSSDVSITSFEITRLGTVGKPNVNINLILESNVTPLNKAPETVNLTQSFTLK